MAVGGKQAVYRFGTGYQTKLVAGMFRDLGFLPERRAALKAHFFDDPHLKMLAGEILRFWDSHHTVPSADAVAELVAGLAAKHDDEAEALVELLERLFDEDLSDLPDIKERAIEFALAQSCLGAVGRALEVLEAGDDPSSLPGLFVKALEAGQRDDDLGLDYLKDRGRFESSPEERAWPTGFPTLDRWLRGGWTPGQLIVPLAPTGVGKTWANVNFAKAALLWGRWPGGGVPHVKPPRSVVYITLEIEAGDIGSRFDQVLFNYSRDTPKGDIEAALDVLMERARNNLFIKRMDAGRATTNDIRSYLTRLESKGIIKRGGFLLIIDYPKLLRPAKAVDKDYQGIQANYLDCRNIAVEWQVPCIGAIQTNRDAYEKAHATPRDFAGSYEVACDADTIIAVCQTPQEQNKIPAEARLLVCKARTGYDGRELVVSFDREVRMWSEKGEVEGGGSRGVESKAEATKKVAEARKALAKRKEDGK